MSYKIDTDDALEETQRNRRRVSEDFVEKVKFTLNTISSGRIPEISDNPASLKIIVLGDADVAKSAFIFNFINNRFDLVRDLNIGLREGNYCIGSVKFEICSLKTEQETYEVIDIAFLTFDVSNRESFLSIKSWLEKIRNQAKPVLVYLLGLRQDESEELLVSRDEAQAFADSFNLIYQEYTLGTPTDFIKQNILEEFNNRIFQSADDRSFCIRLHNFLEEQIENVSNLENLLPMAPNQQISEVMQVESPENAVVEESTSSQEENLEENLERARIESARKALEEGAEQSEIVRNMVEDRATKPKQHIFKQCIRRIRANKIRRVRISQNNLYIPDYYQQKIVSKKILSGHTHSVNALAVLSDNLIVSGGKDKTLRIWDSVSGECLKILEGHTRSVNALAVLSDNRIVSGGKDKVLRIWNPTSGECLQTLEGHTDSVNTLTVLSDDRIVSGSSDKTIRIWNSNTGECIQILGVDDPVEVLVTLSDNRLASAGRGKTIRVWDVVDSGRCLKSLKTRVKYIYALAALSDDCIISGGSGGTICIWNVNTGKCLRTLYGSGSSIIIALTITSEGHIVSAPHKGSVSVWDPTSGECIQILEGHTKRVTSLITRPNGSIVAGTRDHSIRIWESPSPQLQLSSEQIETLLTALTYNSHTIDLILSGSQLADRTINLLFNVLEKNRTIKQLNLANTGLTNEFGELLLSILREDNSTITQLDISENPINSEIQEQLEIAAKNNLDLFIRREEKKREKAQKERERKRREIARRYQETTIIIREEYDDEDDKIYRQTKIVLLGGYGVGKSVLGLRAVGKHFTDDSPPTVSFDFCGRYKGGNYKFQIVDTGSEKRLRKLVYTVFGGVSLSILVFDITRPDTFEAIQYYANEAQDCRGDDALKILVGTKIDLEEFRKVSREQGEALAREIGAKHYIETSAKTGEGVRELFDEIIPNELDAAIESGQLILVESEPPLIVSELDIPSTMFRRERKQQIAANKRQTLSGFKYLLKVVIVGNSNAGKSGLLQNIADNRFIPEHDMTIGIEYGCTTILSRIGRIKLQIWDTAGQECFRSITRSYYRGAFAVFLVFDVANRKSFSDIQAWLQEALEHGGEALNLIYLIGLKQHGPVLSESLRVVSTEEAKSFAEEHHLIYFEHTLGNDTDFITQSIGEKFAGLLERGEIDLSSAYSGVRLCPHVRIEPMVKETRRERRKREEARRKQRRKEAESYKLEGDNYASKGLHPQTRFHYEQALEIYSSDPKKYLLEIADCHNKIGLTFHCQKQYTKAYDHYRKALEIYRKNPRRYRSEITELWEHLGYIYLENNQFDAAEKYFKRVFEMRQSRLGQNHELTQRALIILESLQRNRQAGESGQEANPDISEEEDYVIPEHIFNEHELTEQDINPDYLYQDHDILSVLNTYIRHELPEEIQGYLMEDGRERSFLRFHPDRIQRVMLLSALSNVTQDTILEEAFADVQQLQNSDFPLRILFPLNLGQYHWITGEINIVLQEERWLVTVTVHDPLASHDLPELLQVRIREVFNARDDVDIIFEPSPFSTPRQRDGTSCGVIVAEDIIHRIHDTGLEEQQYSPGAIQKRLEHLTLVQRHHSLESAIGYDFYLRQKENQYNRFVDVEALNREYDPKQRVIIERLIRSFEILPFTQRDELIKLNLELLETTEDVSAYIGRFREAIRDDYPGIYQILFTATGDLQSYENENGEKVALDGGFVVDQLKVLLKEIGYDTSDQSSTDQSSETSSEEVDLGPIVVDTSDSDGSESGSDNEESSQEISADIQAEEPAEIPEINVNHLVALIKKLDQRRKSGNKEALLKILNKIDCIRFDCRRHQGEGLIFKTFSKLINSLGGNEPGDEWLEREVQLRIAEVANHYAPIAFAINHGFILGEDEDIEGRIISEKTQQSLFEKVKEFLKLIDRKKEKRLLVELETLKACIQSLKITANPVREVLSHISVDLSGHHKITSLGQELRGKSRFFMKAWYIKIAKFLWVETYVCYPSESFSFEAEEQRLLSFIDELIDTCLSERRLAIVNAGVKTLSRIMKQGLTENIRNRASRGRYQIDRWLVHEFSVERKANIVVKREKASQKMKSHIEKLVQYREEMNDEGIFYVLNKLWEVDIDTLNPGIILEIFVQLVEAIHGKEIGDEWLSENTKLLITKVANRYAVIVFVLNHQSLFDLETLKISKATQRNLLNSIKVELKLAKKMRNRGNNRLFLELAQLQSCVQSLDSTDSPVSNMLKQRGLGVLSQGSYKIIETMKQLRGASSWYIDRIVFYYTQKVACKAEAENVGKSYEKKVLEFIDEILDIMERTTNENILYAGLETLYRITKAGITPKLQERAFFGRRDETDPLQGLARYVAFEEFDDNGWHIREKAIEAVILLKEHRNSGIREAVRGLIRKREGIEENGTIGRLLSSSQQKRVMEQDDVLTTRISNPERFNVLAKIPVVPYKQLIAEGDVEEIGRGASSIVYQITWFGEKFALKELNLEGMHPNRRLEGSFNKETEIMYKLGNHPNVMKIHCICRGPGHYGMVLDFMEDGSLYNVLHLERDFTWTWTQKWKVALNIAKGIRYLHMQEEVIVHGDLKSQNILCAEDGDVVKISDFNLSRIVTGVSDIITKTRGAMKITYQWSAPELLDPRIERKEKTKKSDMYSYAVILWELATEKFPYSGETYVDVGLKVISGKRMRIPETCPKGISYLIKRCWSQNPKKRPSATKVVTYLKKHRDAICEHRT